MEGSSYGSYTDKRRVYEIKPLRTLKPVFPSGNQAPPPFVCSPPFGPFPPGFSPFYPFASSSQQPHTHQNNNSQPSLVTPIRSFRSPNNHHDAEEPEEGFSTRKKRKIPKKRPVNLNFESGITAAERENGNRKLATSVLARYEALRRRFSQLEDAREAVSGINKRADLKAGSTCMSRGVRTNAKKRPGVVPGVEIGDVFFFRFEMCLVGLHSPSMAGIDYLAVKEGEEETMITIATSIVSSGYYDNEENDPDVLVYTGQGGGNADKEKQTSDQKMERGNLALEKSLLRNSPVRVIRGLKEDSGKIYVYDGLYEVKESWMEKGKSGHNTFKYKLVRAPGQPPAFATWVAIQKWKAGLSSSSREGLILTDLTSGVESLGVSLVNEVDEENGPAYFTYSTKVAYSESFNLTQPSLGCDCLSTSCKPGNLNCHCIRKNGGDYPYCGNGVLVSRKGMVYECSPSCPCSACKSKVTQMGIKLRLEVFKTENRGWGLRSWDPIRAGSFICIYAGEAKEKEQTMEIDDYAFDTTRVYTAFKWNYEHGLADEVDSEEVSEEPEMPLPLVISAKDVGNVGRFMNHSCSPNVFWQPVSYESNGQLCLHVAFFAISHIPPMTELTYDYGVTQTSEAQNGNALHGMKKCFCGSEYCRGSFG
ncbi:Histone-lysine N-methyltransferase [Hirschfeldia incana]|nr:Histone-lysine N-methyltransferase [Hirschfeldia incana]